MRIVASTKLSMSPLRESFEHLMPVETDPVAFQNGSHFDGTIHRTVALRRLAGSFANVAG